MRLFELALNCCRLFFVPRCFRLFCVVSLVSNGLSLFWFVLLLVWVVLGRLGCFMLPLAS